MYYTIIHKETRTEYEIKANKMGENPAQCPVCVEDRKPGNKSKKPFSFNPTKGLGKCQNCDANFYLKPEKESKWVRPVWENKTSLSEKVVDWFSKRNITQDTLVKMKVTEEVQFMPQVSAERNVICFNYFRNGQLINTKYRDGAKNFKLVKDAEKIFYNIDGIKGQKDIYIVEGEMDCLTMIQAGYVNTVSVPNGANKNSNNLDYLDNCYEHFNQAENVFILTDHDEAGENLATELARRIGVEKCYRISLGEFKDVNEQLCQSGRVDVSNATPYPIQGIFGVDDHWADFLKLLKDGFPKGWKPRGTLGNHISFHPGYSTIITGIPGHGKSEVLDQILIQLSIDYDLRGGYFTPENWPTELHMIKLTEKLLGKSAFKCNLMELNKAKEFMSKRIVWVYPEEGYSLDTILDKMRQAVLKFGINWFVIDPWNKLEHNYDQSETKYISSALDKISNFNKKNGTHSFIVAHPTKMRFNYDNNCYEVPGLYDISGSANFYNKADIGLVAYKEPNEQFMTRLVVQKVKFKFWGSGVGEVKYNWDQTNGRYTEFGSDPTNWINVTKKQELIDYSEPNKSDEVPF